MSFEPRKEHELDRLPDEELIAYIADARDAGRNDEARRGLGVLANRRLGDVRRRVSLKVPTEDVDDVSMEVMTSALKGAFSGESVGEFVNWLHTITDRRVADFHRSRENKPDNVPLPEEHESEDDVWGDGATVEDFSGAIDLRSVVDQALGELGAPHAEVVELAVFQRYSARETAEKVNMSHAEELTTPMTEDNVHQISKRFRTRLKELLEQARGGD